MWNFDPINLVKILILSSIAFSILGIFISGFVLSNSKPTRTESILFGVFLLSLTLPLIFVSAPLPQQFWGTMGRNTGFLTYFSLAIIAWALSQLLSSNIEKQAIKFFLLTSIILAAYGLLQALNLEFISWSQKSVFSTLGNVNFYSAFLGISQIVITALLLGGETYKTKYYKFGFISLLILQFFLLVKTDSIQGIAIYCFGVFVVLVLFLFRKSSLSILKFSLFTVLFFVPLATVSILGLFSRGPLARILTHACRIKNDNRASLVWNWARFL
jgi:hypothetical protein